MWFVHFKQTVFSIFFVALISVLIQSVARVYLFLAHSTPYITENYGDDIVKMFWYGLRYDIRGTCYSLVLLFVLMLFTFKVYKRFYPYIATFITIVIGWLAIVNVFYYKTYGRSIDVFIFGLIDDDTKAVLITIWQDYPIVIALISVVVAAFLLFILYRAFIKFAAKHFSSKRSVPVAIVSVLLVIAVFALCMRGSVGTYPLRRNNSQISEAMILNQLTPSPLMALDWAYGDYKNNATFDEATDDDGRAILSAMFGQPTDPSLDAFKAITGTMPPAERRKPHIVFAVMEGMGSHLLEFDSQENDLLGALRPHWNNDIVFKRFVSEGEGTMDSLIRLLVRSYSDKITTSTAQNIDLYSNMFKPYIDNGYKIVFVTSGSGSWRNLNTYLPHLGVVEFVEMNIIHKLYPEAKIEPWGLPDKYMFDYIEQRLVQAEKDGETLFIMALSTTFHPPFKVPPMYEAPVFNFSRDNVSRLDNLAGNSSGITQIFGTLRYIDDTLGDFLSWTKAQSLKDHIIVAITGDHNVRGIDYPSPTERVLSQAVPFYLYLPEEYRAYVHFDPLKVGSHKDILPTLYNLSLEETEYYNTGCNLLSDDVNPFCFGFNVNIDIDETGAYTNNSFRPWADPTNPANLLLGEAEEKSNPYALYPRMLEWQFNRQVQGE